MMAARTDANANRQTDRFIAHLPVPMICCCRSKSWIPALESLVAEQLPIADPCLQPVFQPLQPEELVGRVIILVGGGEGEEHRLRLDRIAKDEADRHCGAHPHPQ